MQFVKKHYEKILLSIVLLGLAAAAALMPFKVASERANMEDRKKQLLQPTVKPLVPLNLSTNATVLARLQSKISFPLGGEHNLFNPVRWQQKADGGLIKSSQTGISALQVTNIQPLHLIVTFDEVVGMGDNLRYKITITTETERPAKKEVRTATKGTKNNLFTVKDVSGPPEDPTALEIILAKDKDPISISRGMPYSRVIGYTADLDYKPEPKLGHKGLRNKDQIIIPGETYNIVAISQDEVVLSASSNAKQTTIKASAMPPK